MSIRKAFNMALRLAPRRQVTLTRPGGASGQIHVCPSNYSRKLEGPSDTVISGREFLISVDELNTTGVVGIRRGDRLADPELGTLAIDEFEELFDMGGAIIGYRVRTN